MPENSGWLASKINELLRDVEQLTAKTNTLVVADRKDYQSLKTELLAVEVKVNATLTKIADIEEKIHLILEYVAPPPPPPLPVKFIVTTELA